MDDKLGGIFDKNANRAIDPAIQTALDLAFVDINPMVNAIYPAKAIHGTAGIMVEMKAPFSTYRPLIGEGAVAFFCWDMRVRDSFGDDDSDDGPIEEVSGYTFIIKPTVAGLCFRHTFEIPEAADPDEGPFWETTRPDPLPEGVQDECIQKVAWAPGFGRLRTIAQREEFAAELLVNVEGVSDHVGAICRGAEMEFAWKILPLVAKGLKEQGLSATKIAAKLGVSRAKIDRALEAEVPEL